MPGNSQYHQRAMEEAGLCSFRLHWPLATHFPLYTYRHVANCCTNKGKEAAQPSPLRKETLGNTKELERKCVCLPFFFFFLGLKVSQLPVTSQGTKLLSHSSLKAKPQARAEATPGNVCVVNFLQLNHIDMIVSNCSNMAEKLPGGGEHSSAMTSHGCVTS